MNDNRKFVCFDVFGRRLELCVSKVETLQAIIMEMGFIILPIRHLWDEITTSLSDDRVPFIFRDSRNLGHDILNDDDWKATICQSGTVVKVFMKPNPDKDPVEQLCLEGKRVTWYRDVSLTEAPNAIGVNFTDPHGRHSILPRVVCTTYELLRAHAAIVCSYDQHLRTEILRDGFTFTGDCVKMEATGWSGHSVMGITMERRLAKET